MSDLTRTTMRIASGGLEPSDAAACDNTTATPAPAAGPLDLTGKIVLVTGATSGIGRETALACARAGADLVLCGRRETALAEVAAEVGRLGRHALSGRVDVSNREEVEAFAAKVHRECGAVDVLINNAGVALGGRFLETSFADWDWLLSINLWGVIHCCHYFIPPMIRRGRGGHVVIVSSAGAFLATSPLAAYSASKVAVLGLAEALRDELRPHGIGVTAVCPGFINTSIVENSRMVGRRATPEARAAIAEFYRRRNYGADRVATAILHGIRRNRALVPVSSEAWMLYWLKRLAPNLTAWASHMLGTRIEG